MTNVSMFEQIERESKGAYDKVAEGLTEKLIELTIARSLSWFHRSDGSTSCCYGNLRFSVGANGRSIYYVVALNDRRRDVPIEHDRTCELAALAIRSADMNSYSRDAEFLGTILGSLSGICARAKAQAI